MGPFSSLVKNMFYLSSNYIMGAALGFLFWLLAARFLTAGEIGVGAALISVVNLIAMFSGMGLNQAVVRLFEEEREQRGFVNLIFFLSGTVCLAVTLASLFGLKLFVPLVFEVLNKPLKVKAFFLLVISVSWLFSTIQDTVFLARRTSDTIFHKNLLIGFARVGLLVVLLPAGALAVLLAWGISVLLGFLLFACLPRRTANKGNTVILLRPTQGWRGLFEYSFPNYLITIFEWSGELLLPLMINRVVGASEAGIFYIAYRLSNPISSIASACASSLFAEASHWPGGLPILVRKVVKFTPYLILIVGTAVIFAPYLLTPFGKVYSTEGKYVFQLLLLGIIPYSFNEVYRVIKQVDKEMSKILFVTSVGMVTSIGFAYLLLNLYGVIGAPLGIIIGRIIKAVTSYLVDRQTITRFLSPNHPVVG